MFRCIYRPINMLTMIVYMSGLLMLIFTLLTGCGSSSDKNTSGRNTQSNSVIPRSAQRSFDYDCDGVYDSCVAQIFHDQGQTIEENTDEKCDGSVDGCKIAKYDEKGRLLSSRSDVHCDGSLIDCTHKKYMRSKSGENIELTSFVCTDDDPLSECDLVRYSSTMNVLEFGDDQNCDGKPDSNCSYFIYETDGKSVNIYIGMKGDCSSNGDSSDFYGSIEFDEAGRPISECRVNYEPPCTETSYDEVGNITEIRRGYGNDFFTECLLFSDYNSYGRYALLQIDDGCDGIFDTCVNYEFDPRGNETLSYMDSGCDGVADENCAVHTYQYE